MGIKNRKNEQNMERIFNEIINSENVINIIDASEIEIASIKTKEDIELEKIKILSDSFFRILQACEKNITGLGYNFQTNGIWVHEYLTKNENDNIYYLIISDMEKTFTSHKFKNKKCFDEIKEQIRKNNETACLNKELNISYSLFDEVNVWSMIVDIPMLNEIAKVSASNINLGDGKVYQVQINKNSIK